MHPNNLSQALATEKIAELVRDAAQARRAKGGQPDGTEQFQARRRFTGRRRRAD